MNATMIDLAPLCAIWPGPWYTNPDLLVTATWIVACWCCFLTGAAYGAWKRD